MQLIPLSLLDGTIIEADPIFEADIKNRWQNTFANRDFDKDMAEYDTYDMLCYSTDFSAAELAIRMGLKLTGWISITNRLTGKTLTWKDIFSILAIPHEQKTLWESALKQQTVISDTGTNEIITLLSVQLKSTAVQPEHKNISWLINWGDRHATEYLLVLLNQALSKKTYVPAPIHWFEFQTRRVNVYTLNKSLARYYCITPVIFFTTITKTTYFDGYFVCRYLPQHELKAKALILGQIGVEPFECWTSLGLNQIDIER